MGASNSVISLFYRCNHEFAEKWGENYHCMDCKQDITDPARIQKEKYMESFVVEEKKAVGLTRGKASQLRGVPIWWIVDWTIENNCWDFPTWKVRREIIVPATQASRCRYVELPHVAQSGFIGPAATYIAHSWQSCWGDLVAALCDGGADRSRRVWIDLFSVRQWPTNQPDFEAKETIAECESFLLVFPAFTGTRDIITCDETNTVHWDNQHPFRRIWCLYEVHVAGIVSQSKDMSIILKGGHHQINADGRVEFITCQNMLVNAARGIDVRSAVATVPQDVDRILEYAMSCCEGLRGFNSTLTRTILGAAYGFQQCTLHCAACGDVVPMRHVLENDLSLVCAAASGYRNVISELLGNAVDVNCRDENEWTALIHAAKAGHISAIEILIDGRANLSLVVPTSGWGALHFAAVHGHASCVEYLLMEGADVAAQSNDGSTALMYAAERGYLDCVQHIISHEKATVDMVDGRGRTAVIRASQSGQSFCLAVLAGEGYAHLDTCDNEGFVALMHAAINRHVNCIETLLDAWATVDYRDFDGKTALMFAATYGFADCVEALVNRGGDIDARSRSAWTPLMYASKFGHIDCVELLLRRGANSSLRTPNGWTAVIAAGESGHIATVQMLRNGIKV